jgi:predicted dehydrogenase
MNIKGMPFTRTETVRIGFIGCGGRGMGLLRDLLAIEGTRIVAVCDPIAEKAEKARARTEAAGQDSPAVYTGTEECWEDLCRRDDLDLIYIATPWDTHVPIAVCAMENGKHAAVEVPAATTIEDCWKLVETSERTRRHCVMLENCCYGYEELLVLNMVRAGLFGELTHAEAAYIHDLRGILLADNGEGLWRREPHTTKNGNLYPTHGLGPVARYLGIHEGDRFTHLVSMSSREASLTEYRDRTAAEDSPKRRERYVCGDMNTTLLRTEKGRTVLLQHDVVTPRPYDRLNMIAGTRGTFRDYPARIFLDGQEGGHDWANLDSFKAEYEHPLWTQVGELARKLGGHGGMDFLMNYRLIQCFREGTAPDIDVYDTAAWSAPGPLSEFSVAQGSIPMHFPDFLGGNK